MNIFAPESTIKYYSVLSVGRSRGFCCYNPFKTFFDLPLWLYPNNMSNCVL